MLLGLAGVAGSTLDRLERRVVGKILAFKIGMAASAAKAGMDGRGKFLSIHEERDGFAGSRGGESLIAVTGEAFIPRLVSGRAPSYAASEE